MWSLTLLQICFLTFEMSYRNKQCSVVFKTLTVDYYYSRKKVQRHICYDIHAFNFSKFLNTFRTYYHSVLNCGHLSTSFLLTSFL